MYSRNEYLEMLKRDLARINNNLNKLSESSNENVGVKVTTTIGNQTTVAQTTQKNISNVTSSIGCLDFSRKADPHIPDGTYVDGVKLEETDKNAPKDTANSTSKIILRIGNQKIESNLQSGKSNTIETSTGPTTNFTKMNDIKINHDPLLLNASNPSSSADHSTTETNAISQTPQRTR